MYTLPALSPVNRLLIILGAIATLGDSLFGLLKVPFSFATLFGLSGPTLALGHFHQLLLYPLPQDGFLSFVFNGLLLWFIGSEIELQWGRRRYILFLLLLQLSAACGFLALTPLLGGGGLRLMGVNVYCFGLLITYGLLYGERLLLFMLIFPVKAKYFCWLLIGVELYMGIFSSAGLLAVAHLAACAAAYAYYWKFLKTGPRTSALAELYQKQRVQRARSGHLTLVTNDPNRDEEEDEKFTRSDKNERPKLWH